MLSNIDTYLFNVINQGLANGLFDSFMPFFTDNSYYFIIPLIVWIFIKDRKKAMIATALSVFSLMFSDWAVHLLKEAIERPRPFAVLDDARVLVGKGKAFSMPSGHAASAFSVVLPIIILLGGFVRPVLMLGAFSIAFSRIYVGVHYPSDVLFGALVGVISAFSVIYLYKWSHRNYKEGKLLNVLLVIVGVVSLFRFYHILTGPFELSPGEACYWDLSRRLDLVYYSNGPLTSYLIAVSGLLFPNTVFGVRIVAVIFTALSSVVLFFLVRRMFDEKTAILSSVLFQFVPMLSFLGIIMFTESVFIFFWIISLYLIWIITERVEKGEKTKWLWMILGLPAGLGFLSGCEMMLFFVCLLLYMLSNGGLRKYFARPYPYIGFIVSLIVCSPMIIWNAGHNWIFVGVLSRSDFLDIGSSVFSMNVLKSLGLQFVMITPILFVLIWSSVLKMAGDMKGKLIFWFSVPPFVLYLISSSISSEVDIWAVAPYVSGLISFSFLYMKGFGLLRRKMRFMVVTGLAVAVAFAVILHYPAELRLPPDKDPFTRFTGWKSLGNAVSVMASEMSDKGDYFIFSDNCNISSEVAFYTEGNPVTYCANTGREMNRFDLWPGHEDMVNYNAIFVMIEGNKMPDSLRSAFNQCKRHEHTTKLRGKVIRNSIIFECYGFKGVKEPALSTDL